MDNLHALFASMRRAFGGDAEGELARALFGFLEEHPATSHVTLQLMRNMAAGSTDVHIVRTLQFLAGDNIQLLLTKFELIEDGDLEPVPLSVEEASVATAENVNPVSGDYDADVSKKIAVFFSPTDHLRELLASSSMRDGD